MASDRYDDEYDDRPRRRPGGGGMARARDMVSGPAIGLIVVGVLSILVALMNVGYLASGMMDAQFEAQKKQMDADPNLDPKAKATAKEFMENYARIVKVVTPVSIGLAFLSGIVIIVAGMKMKGLSGRGLAMTGSVMAMIPCVSGCCLVGIPIGIWAIITLGKPEVKAAFAAASGARDTLADDRDDRD